MFFGLGILWSYAVGAQSLTSIIVAAIISVISGVFIGVYPGRPGFLARKS